MTLRPFFSRSASALFVGTTAAIVACLAIACGGQTVGTTSGGGGSSSGASSCVSIDVTPADTACSPDDDCELVLSGEVCSGQCDCGNTPVSSAAGDAISSKLGGLSLEACPCAFPGTAKCVEGQCTLCSPGSDQPAGCSTTASDSADGGACVTVDPSTYDTSCKTASDCIVIGQGDICPDNCGACPTAPVSASEQARYEAAIAGIQFTGVCSCPAEGPPSCVAGQCVECFGPPNLPCRGVADDSGTTSVVDGGTTSSADASVCVDVDLSSYDRSCTTVNDCMLIVSGPLCATGCSICSVNAAVNQSESAKYWQTVAPIDAVEACPCVTAETAACVEGQCVAKCNPAFPDCTSGG